jgi:hypothetical protein
MQENGFEERRCNMKEFIDKLIERLEEEKQACHINAEVYTERKIGKIIDIVNELAEEYKGNYESVGVLKQIMWERDIAIEQLHELGYEFGQKIAEEYKGGWIPCSERLPETDDYVLCWYEYRIMQGTCEGEMKQTYGIGYYLKPFKNWGGEVSYGRDCKVIAWMPLSAPYTEGE